MRIIGCDLHTRQQTLAMLDTESGQLERLTLKHEGSIVVDSYAALPKPVCVGIEATGTMHWFMDLLGAVYVEALVRICAEGVR